MPGIDYLFDTNVFYDLAEGKLSLEQMETRKLKAHRQKDRFLASVVTLMEILSNIHSGNRELHRFHKFRNAIRVSLGLVDEFLPNPDATIRSIFNLSARDIVMGPAKWVEAASGVAGFEDYESLERHRLVPEDFFQKYRSNIENAGLTHIQSEARRIIPKYDMQRSKGLAAKVTNSQIVKELNSELLINDYGIDALILRAGLKVEYQNSQVRERVGIAFRHFIEAQNHLQHGYLVNGRSIEGNKNDLNDLHLLTYLCRDSVRIVSSDSFYADFAKSAVCERRVIAPEELASWQ